MEECGLTIGGYELVWLADLVVSYVLESASKQFEGMQLKGIYRDDSFIVFDGRSESRQCCRLAKEVPAESKRIGRIRLPQVYSQSMGNRQG